MWLPSWQRNRNVSPARERVPAPRSLRRRASFRPRLDALEDRWLPSTLTVLNNLDSGSGSLRADIGKAHNRDTIVFAPSLDGQTITLASGELYIKKNLTIDGPGAGQLTISAGHTSRIFEVAANYSLSLSGLTISNGFADSTQLGGGAISNHGTLEVSSCTLTSNQTGEYGGAILNDYSAKLTVTNTTLSGNFAGYGGAIANHGSLTIMGSTLSANSAVYGGAIYNTSGGALTINNSSLSDNSATDSGDGGAIACDAGSTMTLSNSTLNDDLASNMGGAISIYGPSTTAIATGCTLTNNDDLLGGNAIWIGSGIMTVSNSYFSGGGPYIDGPYTDGGGNTFT
jgi:hypothetical protein